MFFIHAPCFLICILFYVSFIWLHVYAFAIYPMVHCGVLSSQALLGFLITAPPPVLVPVVLGALAVWIGNQIYIYIYIYIYLFASKVSSSTRCARCVRHSQDFPPRAQYMYEKHFHHAKSWPLCCINPTPSWSVIAIPHRKWLKRKHEVLKFKKSEMVVALIQILIYYSTFLKTKASQSKSFRDLCG